MATIFGVVNDYIVFLYTEETGIPHAIIRIFGKVEVSSDGLEGKDFTADLDFFSEGIELPVRREVLDQGDPYFVDSFRAKYLLEFIDLLRNEKPIYFQRLIDISLLQTGKEPVGEEETKFTARWRPIIPRMP